MIHPILQARLRPAARRLARRAFWWRLAAGWAAAAGLGAAVWAGQRLSGWSSSLAWEVAAGLGVVVAGWLAARGRRRHPDWRALAARIEAAHPELEGRLLTAVEQDAVTRRGLGFLQQRVVFEACDHAQRNNWRRTVPWWGLPLAHAAHLAALAAFLAVIWSLRTAAPPTLLAAPPARGLTVTPGDLELERGHSLVVLARFGGLVPGSADLVLREPGAPERRLAMTRSLNDPLFGGSVTEVTNSLTYHVEYPGGRSQEFTVTVFEHPRLLGADADLAFPAFTALPPKRIPDTRRVTAVEGTRVTLALRLNKPVKAARLVPKDPVAAAVPLTPASNQPAATLDGFTLQASQTYDLRLEDADGRTNKEPAPFTFSALPNRPPELRLTSPRGDLRPSPIEELAFAGTVWDDFGVRAYGLAHLRPGGDPVWIELGRDVPGREKRAFNHLLRLEELALQPADLLSWFVWAEDLGPDGEPRRTTGDLYFGEVRPFDEIFREGESMAGGQQAQQQGGEPEGGPSAQLAELQKQIMSATWKLLRDQPAARNRARSSQVAPADSPQSFAPGPPASRTGPRHRGSGRPDFMAQRAAERPAPARPPAPAAEAGNPREAPGEAPKPGDDLGVVRAAQEQALERAREAGAEVADPRLAALWETAQRAMREALEKLEAAGKTPEALREAFAAQQAAYQALLRLQEREYAVTRGRNQQGQSGGSSRQQQMRRQLDQLELTQSENRYATETRARAPDPPERREQLQTLNRLRELARRQQDLNERLRELQTALEAARTPAEREALRRELKRLQEQERQVLADMDELQQRLDRPENQSRLGDTRQQLEQTRQDVQRAAEAIEDGALSRALAAGSRARDQMERMREDLRRASAGEFAEELRELRAGARELTREQETLARLLDALSDPGRRTLNDAEARQELLDRLARQKQRLTNVLGQATALSQLTEEAEPLVSRQLYDTLRRFSQDDAVQMKQMRQELLERGLLTYSLDDRLQQAAEQDGQGLELTAEMLRQGYLRQADAAEARTRTDLQTLRQGVEQAAEKVLGDDAEALRLAQRELRDLAEQVEREIAAAGGNPSQDREGQAGDRQTGREDRADGHDTERADSAQTGREGREGSPAGAESAESQSTDSQSLRGGQAAANRDSSAAEQPRAGNQPGGRAGGASSDSPNQEAGPRTARSTDASDREGSGPRAGGESATAAREPGRPAGAETRGADRRSGGAATGPGGRGARLPFDLDQVLGGPRDLAGGPITGDDFANWSDRLREVEELVEYPELRSLLGNARERARQMRQEFRRDLKKPDWAVVRLQIVRPLVEVRDQIAEELARREPRDQLVPVDRDPVPARFSELVRRYYEELGRTPPP